MCGGVHYGEVEGVVSAEGWSCSRGASCVVEYTMGRSREWSLQRGGLVAEVHIVVIQFRRLRDLCPQTSGLRATLSASLMHCTGD